MCGFVGFCSLKKELSKDMRIVKDMNNKLQKRGPDEEGYFFNKNINLGHRKLMITDSENKKQPMSIKYNNATYTIVYNGQIYNKSQIKKELQDLGYRFERRFRHRSFIKSIYPLWYKFIK